MRAPAIGLMLLLALYSAIAVSLSAVVLPAAGINGFALIGNASTVTRAHQTATSPEPAGEEAPVAEPPPPREHSLGAARYFNLWLRPFGVHRSDIGDVWWALGSFAVLSTISTMLLFLFPKRVRYVSSVLRAEPAGNHLLNVLLGLLAYCVAYALLRLSWLTIVGMPFIPFLVGAVWLVTMLGIVAVSFTLGRVLTRSVGLALPPLAETLLGLWLLFVTSLLPFLGWIAGGAAAALGFGLLLQTRLGTRQRWALDMLEEPAAEALPEGSNILPLRRAR